MTGRKPHTDRQARVSRLAPATICGVSHAGKVRRNNEDALLVDEENGLCIVADGMGGLQRGEVASRTVVECAGEAVASGRDVAAGFRAAHRRVRGMSDGGNGEGMGATAVAVALDGDRAKVSWVGDSRAYLWRDGELRQVTRDHSFVQELVDLEIITRAEAAAHPNRSVITRAIGVRELERIQVDEVTLALRPGDRLLLCTDGLSSYLDESAIVEELSKATPDRELVERLLERTLAETEAGDNLTVAVMSIRS